MFDAVADERNRRKIYYLFQVVGTFLSLILTIAVLTFDTSDPSWFMYTLEKTTVVNKVGFVGSYCAGLLFYLFGSATYLLVLFAWYLLYAFVFSRKNLLEWDRLFSWTCLITVSSGLVQGIAGSGLQRVGMFFISGGVVGDCLYRVLANNFERAGAIYLLSVLFVSSFIISTRFAGLSLARAIVRTFSYGVRHHRRLLKPVYVIVHSVCVFVIALLQLVMRGITKVLNIKRLERTAETMIAQEYAQAEGGDIATDEFWQFAAARTTQPMQEHQTNVGFSPNEKDEVPTGELSPDKNGVNEKNQNWRSETSSPVDSSPLAAVKKLFQRESSYSLPNHSLFIERAEQKESPKIMQSLQERARALEEKLACFGINGSVVSIKRGPVVTLFEYAPEINTKISKITALEDDLALALQALSIRIIAPIPGRSVVGFEVANVLREDVFLSTLIEDPQYKKFSGQLPLILGKDTIGNQVTVDLARMPHLLIAGSTGSGKSVCLNTMLISLLCSRTPQELQLILIDPKRLEFAAYADIAHLLFPIITDPKRAVLAMRWVVKEMEERYKAMALTGARTIADYNSAVGAEDKKPLIVVIVDELSDLMMTASRDIEGLIARIAQMARAAGIHLIVATQRPSVDVITGLIKVNFPSRISFRVTSKIDSRTIIDCVGADKLLGRGDMLFLDSHDSSLKRVHGGFVSDKEIAAVVRSIRAQQEPQYRDLVQEIGPVETTGSTEDDSLYEEVISFLDTVDEISISLLQRKFRIGYNRSARIIERLEQQGFIMPSERGKTRKVIR